MDAKINTILPDFFNGYSISLLIFLYIVIPTIIAGFF